MNAMHIEMLKINFKINSRYVNNILFFPRDIGVKVILYTVDIGPNFSVNS